ncbi:MAG: DUF5666 domain-containing protein [Patescibacteria group bacterium]|jgi:hypothetical protein
MQEDKIEEKPGPKEEKISPKFEDKYRHHNKAAIITLAIIAVVILVGGMAAVGHAFFHGHSERKFERVSVERTGPDMMGGFGDNMMGEYRNGGMRESGMRRGGHEGKITAVNGDNLTMTNGSSDTSVAILDSTSIYNADGKIISKGDLKVDDQIIVRGRPNSNGVIQAVVIQVTQ